MRFSFTDQERAKLLPTLPPVGSWVTGRVIAVQPFGVFVDLGMNNDVSALLEMISFKILSDQPNHRLVFPDDYPKVGDQIEARVVEVTEHSFQIRLTQLNAPSVGG